MTLLPSDVVELAVVERSGFIESRHLGAAVVLGPDGSVERALGNVDAPVFPRSSLKPIQAAVSVALAETLTGRELGLATASHSGTDAHVAVVEGMLAGGGLSSADLGCPPAVPGDAAARRAFVVAGHEPDRIHMNCSGKHAAMLRACVARGWPTAGYLDPGHQLQLAIADLLGDVAGEPIAAVGVDGCGAPLFAVSLLGLARAVRWATSETAADEAELEHAAEHRAVAAVVHEVLAHPWTIHGPGQENTIVAEELGVFAKGGAEGVLVLAVPNGHVVALKVLDGSPRATSLVGLELLAAAGAIGRADADRTEARLDLAVLGGGEPVGRIRATV
ncbi:asparaginase [Salana multivorans]|uniref:Asparaginase n=1 Tax=Salana multivorans TaxID=120377 RepID=A0A3N2DBW5_9MICO|nr:asparaginase [Salana multivorans]ROR97148.1 asparaginase [Salana multivorans]